MNRHRSVTTWLFHVTTISALLWVTFSYLIAGYSTVFLGQPFPVESLSKQAIETILGVNALKVVGNIFEHNNGTIFGTSIDAKKDRRDC